MNSNHKDNTRLPAPSSIHLSAEMRAFSDEYRQFLDSAPSPFHAASELAKMFSAQGFSQIELQNRFPVEPGKFFLIKDGAFAAWIQPTNPITEFRIFGCHTDSPALLLKPSANSTTADGFGLLEVEIYGGPLVNSWLDRELLVAGILIDVNQNQHLVQTGAIAHIPQLAIHLDRNLNQQGLKLDLQQHLHPVWTVDQPGASVLEQIARSAGLTGTSQILAHELYLYPNEPAKFFGSDQQFLASRRQDNLSSTFAGAKALLSASVHALPSSDQSLSTDLLSNSSPTSAQMINLKPSAICPVFVSFNHEEIGSATTVGAAGPLLENLLHRILDCASATDSAPENRLTLGQRQQKLTLDQRQQVFERSFLISGDAGHSVHPNYPERSDTQTRPVMGRGPILKLNANQRYATSAPAIAYWNALCTKAKVPTQTFVSNNTMPCGSTIGPISATRLGITTVDVGIGLLSMHSTREMCHIADPYLLSRAIYEFWV